MRLAFFYDSRETEKMNLPPGVVALDCADERVAAIARRRGFAPPCLVRGNEVLRGKALASWFASRSPPTLRPAVVRYHVPAQDDDDDDDDDDDTPRVQETAIEKGKRLAAERKQLFGSLFE